MTATVVCFHATSHCQIQDSIYLKSSQDSLHQTKSASKDSTYQGVDLKTPKKAMIRSIILPGLGQAYNKQYWKIPIIYAGLGVLIYAGEWNRSNYYLLRDVYKDMIDGKPTKYDQYSRQNIRSARDLYRKNMELSYIALVGVYGLNILDAFVSAHLRTFDITDDISVQIKPKVDWMPIGLIAETVGGVGLTIRLH
ncbi:MAG: hypothetical protein J5I59_11305 [Saprospiraceae bacterium]|nr:hypothetical protein [Saprospiraceae bacterium]